MSIRSTSNVSRGRAQQAQRPTRRADHDGPSFTELIHSRLFSSYEPPRGERSGAA
ncbi:MAG: hypothetical protein GXY65_13035 [Rhodococcus sp.]|uniref:hypothetical protein n=1 Tax=Rhodococcus TaxID=1827 RepID=UPI0016B29794|nr:MULTISPECIES: hypothetical protein [Rhodococcus]NLV80240.1 hypothetical protein [Rhodococcus sp. (in: high G+C Gram-positive bacteria)]